MTNINAVAETINGGRFTFGRIAGLRVATVGS
jgi:hypothetical protein